MRSPQKSPRRKSSRQKRILQGGVENTWLFGINKKADKTYMLWNEGLRNDSSFVNRSYFGIDYKYSEDVLSFAGFLVSKGAVPQPSVESTSGGNAVATVFLGHSYLFAIALIVMFPSLLPIFMYKSSGNKPFSESHLRVFARIEEYIWFYSFYYTEFKKGRVLDEERDRVKNFKLSMTVLNEILLLSKTCQTCGKSKELNRCVRCKLLKVCGEECQKGEWINCHHKDMCKKIAEAKIEIGF